MNKFSITYNYFENCNALQLIIITHYPISGFNKAIHVVL